MSGEIKEVLNRLDRVDIEVANVNLRQNQLKSANEQAFCELKETIMASQNSGKGKEASSGKEYIWALSDRFGAEFDDPMSELVKVKQIGGVVEFQELFDRVMNRLNLEPGYAISIFLEGLKPELGDVVRILKPYSLPQAYHLAWLQKSIFIKQSKALKTSILQSSNIFNRTHVASQQPTYAKPVTTHVNHLPKYVQNTVLDRTKRRRLTPAELSEKRAKRLCYVCDEKFEHGHMCKARAQLYLLELEEVETVVEIKEELFNREEIAETCEISIYALHGTIGYKTLRLSSYCQQRPLNIFIDTGSTHNFIDKDLVTKMGWKVLQEFKRVFSEPKGLPPFREPFDHHIPLKEGSNPVNTRPYNYSPVQKDVIERVVQELQFQGLIQHSSSPFASPVVLVGKKDGSWKLCVDYRALNQITIKDRYHIPIIEELLDELRGSQVYLKIDLRSGYHQIRMAPSDIHKTAFRTHSGHYEYLVMPFGLTNAPSNFQGPMNHIFQEHLRKFILVVFDDKLIFSKTMQDHVVHLKETFRLLMQHHLFARKSKCHFATTSVEYLGHYISAKGVSTDPKKIQAEQEWPTPSTVKQLRGFLGLAGYYKRFIRGYGQISKPLIDLLKRDCFKWTETSSAAFQSLKNALTTAPVLALPISAWYLQSKLMRLMWELEL
uniref:Reverse transcriptase domain-containing protein n=1 Tax=Nicotiana tabacum TaxID=4097 RepID=A0A1S4BF55_TOBAC|nr:PREDICTED: uncharacterized protein LOC107807660 [Nicotiana tabacum]